MRMKREERERGRERGRRNGEGKCERDVDEKAEKDSVDCDEQVSCHTVGG